MKKAITTAAAAQQLGVTRSWITQLIATGEITGTSFGRVFLVDAASVVRYGRKRKPRGWPKGKKRKILSDVTT